MKIAEKFLFCGIFVISIINVFSQEIGELKNKSPDLKVSIEQHEVNFPLIETVNLTVQVVGYVNEETILCFHQKTDGKSLIEDITNITLNQGKLSLNKTIIITPIRVGHTAIYVKATPEYNTDVSDAYSVIYISHSKNVSIVSDVIGWIYIFTWSFSFYPQTYLNWKRKSVVGFSLDYVTFNTLGFFLYNLFNICLYWIPTVINEYFEKHPYGVNPVRFNDVIYTIHAVFLCSVQVLQCILYERGGQRVSICCGIIVLVILIGAVVCLILSAENVMSWLVYIDVLSYVKLFITIIKCIPQVRMINCTLSNTKKSN